MSRGQNSNLASSQRGLSPRSLDYKIDKRIERLKIDRQALIFALSKFKTKQKFVESWQSESPENVNKIDAIERPAERISTLLQEIYDMLEKEASRQDEQTVFKDDMGRWRKLAVRKYIKHQTADRMTAASRLRDDLQHIYIYPELKDLSGDDVYSVASDIPNLLIDIVKGLKEWREALNSSKL